MIRYTFLSLFLSSVLLFAAPLSEEQAIQKGSDVAATLVKRLGGELKSQMQTSGAIGALHFCSQNAQVITDQVGKESGVQVKRVSLKNRNPINMASSEEQAILNEWEKLQKVGKPLPNYEIKANGQYTYYKPILINNDACLKCHGDIGRDTPLAKEILSTYSDDKAMGYKMGDLRGMIVVTFPR
jgi:hypothetical protein